MGILEGKNAIITGSRRGIGRATVEVFAQNGANVWACARNPDDSFDADMTALAEKYGVWIKPVYFDMASEDEIKLSMRTIQIEKLPIDILVNNAGIVEQSSSFVMTPAERIRRVMEINFTSQMIITQYVSRIMARKKNGSILFLSSIAGLDGNPAQLEYVAAKAAIVGAVKKLAIELGESSIRINAVAPGVIQTDMGNEMQNDLMQNTLNRTVMKRLGRPVEIANVIAFISSDMASYMTGQIIRVDGGM
jgi:3-oxoacyl-[acyl-carrier protein] reductase